MKMDVGDANGQKRPGWPLSGYSLIEISNGVNIRLSGRIKENIRLSGIIRSLPDNAR